MRFTSALLACVFVASNAFAEPTDADRALAQTLFEEGTALMRAGKFSEACPKLAESQSLDPGGGTLINLAVCLEKDGKYASAYLAYNEALAVAERDGNKSRETLARERIELVSALVSRVLIKVAAEAQKIEGLEVHFDTASVRRAAWGASAPVDMGDHVITASAPGRREWRGVLHVDKPGLTFEIEVPVLDALPPTAPPPAIVKPVQVTDSTSGSTSRTVGWALVGTGGAAFVVGAITGALAIGRHSEASRSCTNGKCTTLEGVHAEREADAFAWASNIAFGTAIVAAGVGVALVLLAPSSKKVTVVPSVGGAMLVGRF
jgi:hypothetical protein